MHPPRWDALISWARMGRSIVITPSKMRRISGLVSRVSRPLRPPTFYRKGRGLISQSPDFVCVQSRLMDGCQEGHPCDFRAWDATKRTMGCLGVFDSLHHAGKLRQYTRPAVSLCVVF